MSGLLFLIESFTVRRSEWWGEGGEGREMIACPWILKILYLCLVYYSDWIALGKFFFLAVNKNLLFWHTPLETKKLLLSKFCLKEATEHLRRYIFLSFFCYLSEIYGREWLLHRQPNSARDSRISENWAVPLWACGTSWEDLQLWGNGEATGSAASCWTHSWRPPNLVFWYKAPSWNLKFKLIHVMRGAAELQKWSNRCTDFHIWRKIYKRNVTLNIQ